MAMKERTGRSRVSKADEIVNKIDMPAEAASSIHTRVRPASKTDEISRKIPSPKPAADRRPSHPEPQQASSRVTPPQPVSKPTAKKKSGCCLLPFTLAVAGIAAALIVIF